MRLRVCDRFAYHGKNEGARVGLYFDQLRVAQECHFVIIIVDDKCFVALLFGGGVCVVVVVVVVVEVYDGQSRGRPDRLDARLAVRQDATRRLRVQLAHRVAATQAQTGRPLLGACFIARFGLLFIVVLLL